MPDHEAGGGASEPAEREPARGEPCKGEPIVRQPAGGESRKSEPTVRESARDEPCKGEPAERESPGREPVKSSRIFFALWPSPAMQSALAAASAHAVSEVQKAGARAAVGASAGASVRPVPPANFHLTLAFLGSVPLSRLSDVEHAAAGFAAAFTSSDLPIEIVLDAVEHWRKPQVLVATASNTPGASVALAEGLQRSLVDAGFTPDLKPFRVHATIARKVRRVDGELPLQPVHWSFDSFHLVESQTHPNGSAYRTLKKWALDKRD